MSKVWVGKLEVAKVEVDKFEVAKLAYKGWAGQELVGWCWLLVTGCGYWWWLLSTSGWV